MTWANVCQVASCEAKLLWRSGLFRLNCLLVIGCVGGFHLFFQSHYCSFGWSFVALPSSYPYVNAFLFSLIQSFFILFVVGDLWEQERRTRTLDVFRIRSISNWEYMLGKFVGILYCSLLLDIFVMCLGGGINLFSSTASFNPVLYLFYGLTLAFPSLIFMLGISFFAFWGINNRWLASLTLLSFFFLTVFLLPGVRWDTFNFFGNTSI